MTKKIILICFFFLLIIAAVSAKEVGNCEEISYIQDMPCFIISETPYIGGCGSHSINFYNAENGSAYNTLSYETFDISGRCNVTINLSKGTYIFNDTAGRNGQIYVIQGERGNTMLTALILLPILFAAILVYITTLINFDEIQPLKIMIYLLSFILFWVSLHFGLIGVVNFYDIPDLENSIATLVYWSTIFLWFLIVLWVMYAIYSLFKFVKEYKGKRYEY